jgi:hypothetical protein
MIIMLWFWSGVITQALCTLHLLMVDWTGSSFPQRRWVQIWWTYSIGALPPLWHALSSIAFEADWKGERERHWFYYIHDSAAGLVLVPFLLVAGLLISRALTNTVFRRRSSATLLVLHTCVAICAWYVLAIIFFDYVGAGDGSGPAVLFVLFPAVSGLNYILLGRMMKRECAERSWTMGFVYAWCSSLVVALVAKVILARRFYAQLPDENQSCFVVSAAARGHVWLVGSWRHPELGKPVNRQWQRFKALEDMLRLQSPRFHARFRRVYGVLGPCVACGVRNAWVADLVYLALKPLELIAVLCTRLGRR